MAGRFMLACTTFVNSRACWAVWLVRYQNGFLNNGKHVLPDYRRGNHVRMRRLKYGPGPARPLITHQASLQLSRQHQYVRRTIVVPLVPLVGGGACIRSQFVAWTTQVYLKKILKYEVKNHGQQPCENFTCQICWLIILLLFRMNRFMLFSCNKHVRPRKGRQQKRFAVLEKRAAPGVPSTIILY